MPKTLREILRNLVDDSAGCICIEYEEGKCPCSGHIDQAISEIQGLVPEERKEKLSLKDYRFLNSISLENIEKDEERNKIFNSAIKQVKERMGK